MHVKVEAPRIEMVENRCSIFSYGGPHGICFQTGVRGLTSVNLGVLGMKTFEILRCPFNSNSVQIEGTDHSDGSLPLF